ncbi:MULTISPECIES: DUF998 domain-containing protein [unclassified Amycolatopsis]|uniref:DUF998 domain-containing protein n=1 Tax=unclassified Amycolatopsis TaxID=2618356 RepID=UPI002876764F|nr:MULTISPECIES: DUF998 domain-containing protein [unclassified Amycolatopsis]MDS0134314.1 DUF998 domain-containing protein [Amycolatopsis sp. 505]MDS0148898.1 DUF998 domain-containing protein [Amycolatopsis sp. CM201R]
MSSVETIRPAPPTAAGPRQARVWAAAAIGCFGLCVATALLLHVTQAVDPVRQVISDYALSPAADGFGVCVLTLAGGTGFLLVGLGKAGLPVSRPVVALAGCWGGGLTLCAFFPTIPTGAPMTLSAEIHRFAGLVLFLSLPAAAGLLARDAAGHPVHHTLAVRLRRHTDWAWAALTVFLLSQLPVLLAPPRGFDGPLFQGLAERLVFVVYLVLLGEPALAVLRSGRKSC